MTKKSVERLLKQRAAQLPLPEPVSNAGTRKPSRTSATARILGAAAGLLILLALTFTIWKLFGARETPDSPHVLDTPSEELSLTESPTEPASEWDFTNSVVYEKADGLYAADLRGHSKRIFETRVPAIYNLSLSPSGRYVVFWYNKDANSSDAFLVSIADSHITELPDRIGWLCWDQKSDILFVSVYGEGVYSHNVLQDESATLIIADSVNDYPRLTVSPDGKILYYYKGYALYGYDIESGQEELLFERGMQDENHETVNDYLIDVSDDGNWLYFYTYSDRGAPSADGVVYAVYDLRNRKWHETFGYAHGENSLIITEMMFPAAIPASGGKAVTVAGSGREAYTNKRIVSVDAVTGEVCNLSPPDQAAVYPAVSDDKALVAYCAMDDYTVVQPEGDRQGANTNFRLYVTDIDNPSPRALTDGGKYTEHSPRFLSDGKTILFARIDWGNHLSLWTVGTDGGEPQLLAEDLYFDASSWESEGYVIYGHIFDAVSGS